MSPPDVEIVLCLDVGTTNTTVLALNCYGRVVAHATQRTDLSFPRPGWAESDPVALWRDTALAAQQCLEALDRPHVLAVGVANQRETAVIWDRATGAPLGPAVSWQCGRSQARCQELRRDGHEARIRELSGLHLSPMFSAGKMAWLLDQVPNGRARGARGDICIGTVDSWILWNLTDTGEHRTDLTNASRTQLLDLDSLEWCDELLELFSIPKPALANVFPTAAQFGICTLPGAGRAPVCALAGDSHASLVAHGVLAPGGVKATFGTGTSVLAPVSGFKNGTELLSRTIGWSRQTANGPDVVRAVEGNIYATGAALDFVASLIGCHDVGGLDAMATPERGAASDVFFVPAMSGLGAPYWDASAAGTIIGLTRGSTADDLARAAFEAIAFQVSDVLDALPTPHHRLHVDGGAMRSDLLAQLVADITGTTVTRTNIADLSAVGAGYLAGHQVGLWGLDDLDRLRPPASDFEPSPDRDWTVSSARWRDAVARSRAWTPDIDRSTDTIAPLVPKDLTP